MPRRNFSIIVVVAAISLVCYFTADRNPYGHYFSEVMDKIDRLYVEPVDRDDQFDEKLFGAAVKGMIKNTLDEHSAFYDKNEAEEFLAEIDQRYGGVGIQFTNDSKSKQLTVLTTLVDSPAYRADILNGDRIIKIADRVIDGMSIDEIKQLIRGEVGTPVKLALMRPGRTEPIELTLKRADIRVDSVTGYSRNPDDSWNFTLPQHPHLGYVRIANFGERTGEELEHALQSLRPQGLKGLVLDLRFDPGGRLDAAVDVCGMFIPSGRTVVTTKGRNGVRVKEETTEGPGTYTDFPIVVLVNSMSASASEIVAACLQDYHRAIVVGQRSYGKGSVQNVIELEGHEGILKLTTAYYWRPSGKNIHRRKDAKDTDQWGVMPDEGFEVKLTDDEMEKLLDAQQRREIVHKAEPPAPPDEPATKDRPNGAASFDPQLKRGIEYLIREHSGAAAKIHSA